MYNSIINICLAPLVFSISLIILTLGSYDPVQYYYLAQFSDNQCTNPTSITMMAVNKCFSQTLGAQQNTASYVGYATSTYAKATFAQGSTTTSLTLTLISYSDSSCTQPVSGSTTTMTLPAAPSQTPYGPYGSMSQCATTLPGGVTANNIGGLYSFNNKLELEAMLSYFTQGTAGPVYGTFADPYCSVENTNDPSGNQLPIYAQWSANNACTYNFLTQKFKRENCNSGASVSGTGAFSNTWQGFSENTCTTSITTSQSYSETDVRKVAHILTPLMLSYNNLHSFVPFPHSLLIFISFLPLLILS